MPDEHLRDKLIISCAVRRSLLKGECYWSGIFLPEDTGGYTVGIPKLTTDDLAIQWKSEHNS